MDSTTKFFLLCAYPDLAFDDWITIKGTHVETDENGELKGAVGQKIAGKKSRFSGAKTEADHTKPVKINPPPIKKISDTEFETGSNFTDGVKIVSYKLSNGSWQSDVYVGRGRGQNNIMDRNQHKTESAAKKWAEKEMRIREQKYRTKIE